MLTAPPVATDDRACNLGASPPEGLTPRSRTDSVSGVTGYMQPSESSAAGLPAV
jgi:hypothetical protein